MKLENEEKELQEKIIKKSDEIKGDNKNKKKEEKKNIEVEKNI